MDALLQELHHLGFSNSAANEAALLQGGSLEAAVEILIAAPSISAACNNASGLLFKGDHVIRGPDWSGRDAEDGGEGSLGIVLQDCGGRVRVRWLKEGLPDATREKEYNYGNGTWEVELVLMRCTAPRHAGVTAMPVKHWTGRAIHNPAPRHAWTCKFCHQPEAFSPARPPMICLACNHAVCLDCYHQRPPPRETWPIQHRFCSQDAIDRGDVAAPASMLPDPAPTSSAAAAPAPPSSSAAPASALPFPKTGVKVAHLGTFIAQCGGRAALQSLTTTQVNDAHQKPLTFAAQSSYCDLLLSQGDAACGTATVFISHAWKYVFLDVVDALEHHFRHAPDTIVWFDLFSNNQHKAVDLDFDWWCNTFKSAIAGFKHTVMVMAPWHDPIPLTRGWCLFELYCTAVTQSRFEVAMSHRQTGAFFASMFDDCDGQMKKMMATIDCERSECFKPEDRQRIFDVVRSSVGFAGINALVYEQLQKWVADTAEKELANVDAADVIRKMNLTSILGMIYVIQGQVAKAKSLLSSQVAESASVYGQEHEYSLKAQLRLAASLQQTGDLAASVRLFKELYPKVLAMLGPDDEATLMCQLNLGAHYASHGEYALAEPMLADCLARNRAIEAAQQQASTSASLRCQMTLGYLWARMGKPDQAEPALRDCLERYSRECGVDHPNTFQARAALGTCLTEQKRHIEAEPLYRSILQRQIVLHGRDNLLSLKALEDLAICLDYQGRPSEAVPLFKEALAGILAISGPDHHQTIGLMNGLGVAYVHLKNYAEAEALLTQVMEANARLFGPHSHNPMCLVPIGNLAVAKDGLGKLHEAERLHTLAVSMKTSLYGSGHPSTETSKRNLLRVQDKIRAMRFSATGPSSSSSRRFRVGDRVQCSMDGWSPGVVIALDYSEPSWPRGMIAPYQVQLDNGLLICAPEDHDGFIRRATAPQFGVRPPSEAYIAALESMGFTRVEASDALRCTNDDLAAAVERLLNGAH